MAFPVQARLRTGGADPGAVVSALPDVLFVIALCNAALAAFIWAMLALLAQGRPVRGMGLQVLASLALAAFLLWGVP
jgi:hypothetical protein